MGERVPGPAHLVLIVYVMYACARQFIKVIRVLWGGIPIDRPSGPMAQTPEGRLRDAVKVVWGDGLREEVFARWCQGSKKIHAAHTQSVTWIIWK